MQNSIFNFPDYFYSSLRCPKDLFISAWYNIPDYDKHNINMWAAVSMVCIELSNRKFYQSFDHIEETMNYENKAFEILMDADVIFHGAIYEGFQKIIDEQREQHVKVRTADEVLDVLNHRLVNRDSVSFEKFGTHVSIIIGYSHKNYIENKFIVIRDILSSMGWYMSMCNDASERFKNHPERYVGYLELVFEPIQIPEATVDIRRENKVMYHITPKDNIESIKKVGLLPSNDNKKVDYSERRVYFLRENIATNSFSGIIHALCRQKSLKRNNVEMCCLVIDVSKIPQDVKFYYDTHEEYGLFTTGIIPPSAIERIYIFDDKDRIKDTNAEKLLNKVFNYIKKVFSLS